MGPDFAALLAAQVGSGHLRSLSLSFFFCKMGKVEIMDLALHFINLNRNISDISKA